MEAAQQPVMETAQEPVVQAEQQPVVQAEPGQQQVEAALAALAVQAAATAKAASAASTCCWPGLIAGIRLRQETVRFNAVQAV